MEDVLVDENELEKVEVGEVLEDDVEIEVLVMLLRCCCYFSLTRCET